ncbi:hypothetical protein [Alkaliphilus serpentinus]|uniref:Uncharacterized protein n=1 Tax=Alkaliphilus serpentinus TaxID=1482731 RepID=A0A833HLL2_9FIRM|nr:hypothetical protein [Alkaliphilus serpentinus]KAB3525937.1 hypothetical protein F8153_14505 [Alkaliphilus serpentinus]
MSSKYAVCKYQATEGEEGAVALYRDLSWNMGKNIKAEEMVAIEHYEMLYIGLYSLYRVKILLNILLKVSQKKVIKMEHREHKGTVPVCYTYCHFIGECSGID